MNILSGRLPLVYLLKNQGKTICRGKIGMLRKASVSLLIPASVSFNGVPESVTANAILQVRRRSAKDWMLGSRRILYNILYVSATFISFPLATDVFSDLNSHTKVVVAKKTKAQKYKNPKEKTFRVLAKDFKIYLIELPSLPFEGLIENIYYILQVILKIKTLNNLG